MTDTATDTVLDLMRMLFKLAYPTRKLKSTMTASDFARHQRDFLRRGLCCTPYGGNYDKLAGWLVCVVGSPPKGTLILEIGGPDQQVSDAFWFYGRSKLISTDKNCLPIVQAFFNEHLRGRHEAFRIDTKGVA
jgi:hypothetical protein